LSARAEADERNAVSPLERGRPGFCLHCDLPLGPGAPAPFCCHGCAAVFQLIHQCELERYYDIRSGAGVPVPDLHPERRDTKWLEPIETRLRATPPGQSARVDMDVQGLHCAGCVWLIQKLFADRPGAVRVIVNPGRGKVELLVGAEFPLTDWIETVERFGYLFGPPLKHGHRASDALLMRMVICLALAGNAMLFASAVYLGLDSGPLYTLMHWLTFGMGLVAVAVGGPVFMRPAWQGLRHRVLSFDLPISLGILLAFAGSTWALLVRTGNAIYFDTIAVFIALMLVGRWLQQRMLESNRDRLLTSEGAAGLRARRIRDGAVELVPCTELRRGDVLLVVPGDLVPVEVALLGQSGRFSLDWVSGESSPVEFVAGAPVPAGAFNAGKSAVRARVATDFAESPLIDLLQSPSPEAEGKAEAAAGGLARRIAGVYVVVVLAAAALGLAAWLASTGDVHRALEVATAVLVVTCPCAFGIATPLAHELAHAGLRRAGLFVRRAGFLDRATGVRRIIFDKTGTLTTGALALAEPELLDGLDGEHRALLYDMAARSSHPASDAVRAALAGDDPVLREGIDVREEAGKGVEARVGGRRYRLGAQDWVARIGGHQGQGQDQDQDRDQDQDQDQDQGIVRANLAFAGDGVGLVRLTTVETLRPDGRDEVNELRAAGFDLWILSGDEQERVERIAGELGLERERALGGRSPSQKAAWVEEHEPDSTLFIGDGINDALVASAASCSGTPAIDRPFMAARSDFYFVTTGLAPIRRALDAARALAVTIRRNLAYAIAYNTLAVGLAWAGLMKPWLAAVLMPASSIAIVLATVAALSPRNRLWTS